MKCLLSALALVCVIALCFSVGKTYAVITEATNVVVNTFYGESESQETKTDEPDTEEPGTEETEASGTETTLTGTETSETDTGTSGTETEAGTSETDTAEGVKTGDGFNILLWIIIALAALIVLLFCLRKLFRPRKK